MGCQCAVGGSGVSYAQCAGATIIDPQPDSIAKMYAAKVGAPTTGSSSWVVCVISAMMATRRFLYWKNAPGDCGQNTAIQLGATAEIGAGINTAASADPEPISKSILTGIAQVFGVFTASHAKAVVKEQTTLCDVANAYNKNAFAIEQLLLNGQFTPQQAVATLQQIVAQLQPYLGDITKQGNAAWGYNLALQALTLWNQDHVYNGLYRATTAVVAPGNPAAVGSGGVVVAGTGPTVPPGSQPVNLPSAVAQAVTTGQISPELILLLGGLGLVVAKFA